MEVKLNQRELLEGLKRLKAVNRKVCSLPILEGVKLAATEHCVVITASNLEVEENIIIRDVEIIDAGECVISAKTLKLLEKIKNGELTVTEDKLKIGSKKISYISANSAEFPTYKKEKFENEIMSMTEKEFTRLMRVSQFTSKDNIRPILKCVNIKNNKFCALDGFKLALSQSNRFNLEKEINLTTHSIHTLNKILDKKSENMVKFFLNERENLLKIEFKDHNVITRIAEDKFVEYESLIPQENNNSFNLNSEQIEKMLDILKFAKEFNEGVKYPLINMNIKNEKINFKAKDIQNIYEDEIIIEKCKDVEINFNTEYLEEAVKWINNDSIKVEYEHKFAPMILTNNLNDLMLILPVRVANKN